MDLCRDAAFFNPDDSRRALASRASDFIHLFAGASHAGDITQLHPHQHRRLGRRFAALHAQCRQLDSPRRGIVYPIHRRGPGLLPISRASLLRGQYVHDHGILRGSNKFGEGKLRSRGLEDSTIATWLRRAGYRTAFVGKYLNGYEDDPTHVPPGWTEWYATFSYLYFDYQMNENGKLVSYGSEAADYQTDVLSQKSVSFIRRSAKAGKRFFLYLTPSAPHGPATPAPRHESLFADTTAPQTASFSEENVSDKPRVHSGHLLVDPDGRRHDR